MVVHQACEIHACIRSLNGEWQIVYYSTSYLRAIFNNDLKAKKNEQIKDNSRVCLRTYKETYS